MKQAQNRCLRIILPLQRNCQKMKRLKSSPIFTSLFSGFAFLFVLISVLNNCSAVKLTNLTSKSSSDEFLSPKSPRVEKKFDQKFFHRHYYFLHSRFIRAVNSLNSKSLLCPLSLSLCLPKLGAPLLILERYRIWDREKFH